MHREPEQQVGGDASNRELSQRLTYYFKYIHLVVKMRFLSYILP